MSKAKLSPLEWLFPKWSAKRMYYHDILSAEKERNYNAGRKDRLNNWIPINATAETIDRVDRPLIRARARHLERNSDTTEAIVGAFLRNCIGTGIRPQARVKQNSGKFNDKFNKDIERLWKHWIKAGHCDIAGHQTFYEMQEMALRRRVVDGEIFIRPVISKDSEFPLKLQFFESDQIPDSLLASKSTNGHYLIAGIEVDEYYKPLVYHVTQQTPDGFSSLETIAIPANQMIHLFKKLRPSQVRGISELARIINGIKDTDDYLEAELVAARIAASFAVFITKQGSTGIPGRDLEVDDEGNRVEKIRPGIIERLRPGEDVRFANPARNASNAKDYLKTQERKAAAGTGQSYEVVSRDMSETNYSSARQNHLEDRKTWIPVQQYMVDHFCQPIWEDFVKVCVIKGFINAPDFWSNPEKYYDCQWIAPGWTWIDPLKDVKASIFELGAGMTTLSQICAEQGRDWQEVIDQRAREEEYCKEKNVTLSVYNGGGKENEGTNKTQINTGASN